MTGDRTFEFLKQLETENELERFKDFLNSPFHVKNASNYLKLIDGMYQFYESPNSKSEQQLFEYIYTGEEYIRNKSSKRLSQLCVKTNQYISQFLAHTKLQQSPHQLNYLLFRTVNERGLNIIPEKQRRDWQSDIISDVYNLNTFLHRFRFEKEEFETQTRIQRGRSAPPLLINSIQFFSQYYAINRLWLTCQLKNFEYIFQLNAEEIAPYLFTLEEMETFLAKHKLSSHPLAKIYLRVYKILIDREDYDSFEYLKETLMEQSETFPKDMAVELYTYIANFCIHVLRQERRSDFFKHIFEIYEDQINKKLLTTNRYVPIERLNNIIGAALNLGYIDKAENMIEIGCAQLHPDLHRSAKYYFGAMCFYAKGEFDEALGKLRYVNRQTDGHFEMGGKVLEIRCLYEKNEFNLVDFRLKAFEQFVRQNRQRISNDLRKSYQGFITICKGLIRLQNNPNINEKRVQKLLERLKTTQVTHRDWLMAKINELMISVAG